MLCQEEQIGRGTNRAQGFPVGIVCGIRPKLRGTVGSEFLLGSEFLDNVGAFAVWPRCEEPANGLLASGVARND